MEPSTTDPATISLGTRVEVVRQTIPGTGGVLNVNKPGDPLHGLVLTVPTNGFAQAQDFVISRSEITSIASERTSTRAHR